jgi:hypothetical protein
MTLRSITGEFLGEVNLCLESEAQESLAIVWENFWTAYETDRCTDSYFAPHSARNYWAASLVSITDRSSGIPIRRRRYWKDGMQNSPAAVRIALAHIDAWSRHDWDKTKELLAPNVHVLVTTTMPNWGVASEFTGIDNYMALKVKAAQLIEPGSVQVIGTIGDESNALTLVTFRIGLGPGGTIVTMARACLYFLDKNNKIKEERDSFFILSSR